MRGSPARVASLLILLAPALAGCGEGAPKQAAPAPPAVTVAKPTKQQVTDYDEYVGRFIAVDSVEIRARVSGYLDKVHFKDGQIVKQGDPLFNIDRRPFETAAAQARATLAQARANLAFTESDLTRASQLVRDRTITEQVFEQRTQAKRVAEASVAAQEASVRQAELDLQFTELKAPVSGRIGDRRVSEGNLVTGGTGGNTTLLATIVSIDPIRFEFTFDEASFLRYERLSKEGKDVASRSAGVEVAVKLIDEPDFAHAGKMDFVDNVIERASGTIRGRARAGQPERRVHARHVRPRARARLAAFRGAAAARQCDRLGTGAQIRAGGRRRKCRAHQIRHARPARRQSARHQGRRRPGRPRDRQRADARAPRRQGDAAGAGRFARRAAGEELGRAR